MVRTSWSWRSVAAVAAAGLTVAATGIGPAAAGARAASFSVQGELTGVVALSASNAWVVGSTGQFGGAGTLIAHWNGKSWQRVHSPSPGRNVDLNGVAATSSRDVWAVGAADAKTLILHWNGRSWKRIPSPSPAPICALTAVAAVSASNAWAVGYGDPSGGDLRRAASGRVIIARTLILHWNGKNWKRVPSPNPDEGGHLTGVTATSAGDAWAVGEDEFKTIDFGNLFLHWNGHAWKAAKGPNPGGNSNGLLGVDASSRTSAWAVGNAKRNGSDLDHWNGSKWNQVLLLRTYILEAVSSGTSTSTWAVGGAGNGALILRLHGAAWRRAATPHPANEFLTGVTAASSRDAWAVGSTNGSSGDATLILHWNGTRWSS
ncbi:MAG TPA: hypothetical protein VFI65_27185 [Streptosporangiaceae bacterium]|nr:hypothetical protein [Streptosporangiaceae bacterium]